MCQIFEELAEKRANERVEEVREEMRTEEKKRLARRMIEEGELTIDKIARYADLPLEEVKKLAELQPA